MLSQRVIRFHKRKIIGGNFLKNVFDKVRNVVSTGSKILNRIPIVHDKVRNSSTDQLENVPLLKKAFEKSSLSDRSRAILSNLIAGSGFKNYV